MENKERKIKLYLSVVFPLGLGALIWAFYRFPVDKINAGLIALSIVTVFFSSYLRIQLPRTKIHLTVSDALIILSLLIYGGEVAVLPLLQELPGNAFGIFQSIIGREQRQCRTPPPSS